jgi:hypothetical protein
MKDSRHTFFFIGLWMASSASRIVTPFMLRAVTSIPVPKRRSIFLTNGVVNGFLRSTRSIVPGLVFIFLQNDKPWSASMEKKEESRHRVH